MQYRELGRTGGDVSAISFGAGAIGGAWGEVDDSESFAALHRALDLGVNFFDTADVYGDGRSERLMARLRRERHETFYVATKAGRRLDPHVAEGYNRKNLTAFIERSLQNLETEALDLLQLHCPPTEVYYMPEVFGILDDLVQQGKLRHYGVSVEKVEEALKAIEYPNVKTVQIIYNIFRQRPADLFFQEAKRRKVGILARVPLASGLLTGKSPARARSRLTTTVLSTGTVRPSTAERPSPVWISRPAWRLWRRSENGFLPGPRCPRWRCAGS
jgi:aryl-alcohol dehydrogenase-like predicted oxidoreductase